MKQGLELCEKALDRYLETKRKAFPRFYFLSNTALLDLLSNGTNPPAIQRHMGDCFDQIKALEIIPDRMDLEEWERRKELEERQMEEKTKRLERRGTEPVPKDSKAETKKSSLLPATLTIADNAVAHKAIAMLSKAGAERVKFARPFMCVGPVEQWLGGVVKMMRRTLRQLLRSAKEAADLWGSQGVSPFDNAHCSSILMDYLSRSLYLMNVFLSQHYIYIPSLSLFLFLSRPL